VTRNRQLLLLGLVALLIAGRDFATRIYVGRDESLRHFAVPAIRAVPAAPNAATLRARLLEWLPATGAAKAADPNDAAAWEFYLAGIFTSQGQRFAVITSVPRGGGAPERTRLAPGDGLKGYVLREIATREVTLEGKDGLLRLALFDRTKPPPSTSAANASISRQPHAPSPLRRAPPQHFRGPPVPPARLPPR
jgi:hypothetical protein